MPIGMKDLDPVLEFYQASLTGYDKVRGFLNKSSKLKELEQSVFYAKTAGETDEMFTRFRDDLNDLVIVSLVSVFEHILYKHPKSPLLDESNRQGRKDVHDAIAYFESLISSPESYASVESLCTYRNWVAHGKRWAKPSNAEPFTAKKQLVIFLGQIGLDRQY